MLAKFKSYLESIRITPVSWLLGVSGVLMVRFFLESFSSPTATGFFASDASTLIHYYLFFMAGLLALMLFLSVVIPNWKHVIPQFVVVTLPAVFIPPIVDWMVSGGKGFKVTYFFDKPSEMLHSLLNFGSVGTTIGLKVEMAAVFICFGILVYLIQKSWQRAIVSPILLYLIVFFFASLPGIVSVLGQTGNLFQIDLLIFFRDSMKDSATIANNLHGSLVYGSGFRLIEISFNFMMGKVLFLVTSVLACVWFFVNFKSKFKALVRNSRPQRASHYIFTILFGAVIAWAMYPPANFNWNDWFSIVVLCLAFYFSGMFAICVNDLADEDIDRISNSNRPLITGVLSRENMKQASVVFLLASLLGAFLAGYTAFFFVLAFTALYYIYSVPPTRFKIVPLFSSFLIGLCYATAILSGFFLISASKSVSAFPPKLFVATVIVITFLAHARDVKDIKGDKAVGIKTIPVLFGEVWGLRIVGLLTAISFVLIPLFSGLEILYVVALPASIASYYFINKKPYSERPLYLIYFLFVLFSILLLFV